VALFICVAVVKSDHKNPFRFYEKLSSFEDGLYPIVRFRGISE